MSRKTSIRNHKGIVVAKKMGASAIKYGGAESVGRFIESRPARWCATDEHRDDLLSPGR